MGGHESSQFNATAPWLLPCFNSFNFKGSYRRTYPRWCLSRTTWQRSKCRRLWRRWVTKGLPSVRSRDCMDRRIAWMIRKSMMIIISWHYIEKIHNTEPHPGRTILSQILKVWSVWSSSNTCNVVFRIYDISPTHWGASGWTTLSTFYMLLHATYLH